MDFTFFMPARMLVGENIVEQNSGALAALGSRCLIVTGKNSAKASGALDDATAALDRHGIPWQVFDGIGQNPLLSSCHAAGTAARNFGADFLIGIGGGSPLDAVKAAAVYAANPELAPPDVYGGWKTPALPFALIGTTAGTGSEVTASSVITDASTNYKMAIISYNLIPSYALLDPEMIMSLPAGVAASCGVDAFIHALEAYVSKEANPFTDAMAEKAMELIGGSIRRFVASRDNEEAACNMMLGSTLAGISFAWAKLGNVHAMSHPVSGFFHVAHGVANSILLPNIVEFNALADNGRYRKIYDYITNGKKADDSFTPDMLADALRQLNKELGIPATLSEVGVTEDKIPEMTIDAMKSGNILTNPRQTTSKDVEMLYRKTL